MDRHASPPNTPLTQEFNEASSTIEDLTASLTSIHRRVSTGTPSLRGHGEDSWEEEKKELEGELMLCAEIGQALLRRHESYVGKAEKEVGGLRANVSGSGRKGGEGKGCFELRADLGLGAFLVGFLVRPKRLRIC